MKLVKKAIERDRSGFVVLMNQDSEDMWHTYNLISAGDTIKASTLRYVVSESNTGSTSKDSVRLTLSIAVETVEFDVQVCMLRVNGRNIEENKYVKMGGYHTIELELNRKFTLTKPEWDIISFERIKTACDVVQKADIAAIVLQEGMPVVILRAQGLANVALVTENMTVVRQRIECPVPRKSKGSSTSREKGLNRYVSTRLMLDFLLRSWKL
jgi:protein pelota